MKYSAEEINNLSYLEWMEIIAKELNAAGFKGRGYSETAGCMMKDISPYNVDMDNVHYFFLGCINDAKAMDYLKSLGLVNNKRCPMCGAVIKGRPSKFTDGFNPDLNFHICSSCRRDGQGISINSAKSSGCLLALILIPWNLIKNLFTL